MKITSVEAIMLRLPDIKRIADGAQTLLVVRVHTDEGLVGIGEINTSELVGKAVIEAPFSSLSTSGLAELIVGRDPLDIGARWDDMFKYSGGYGRGGIVLQGISAIDMALWDILGKAAGLPVYRLLGGARQRRVKLYASNLDGGSEAARRGATEASIERGFKAVKLGWGSLGENPKEDASMIKRIRDSVGPDVDLMLDLGHGLPLPEATTFCQYLEESDLYFVEEPLAPDNFAGFDVLTRATRVPIATGEKLGVTREFNDLIDRGNVRLIQPDLARVGGFSEMQRIGASAELRSATIIPHCWASDILVAASLHFVAAMREPQYLEFCVHDQPLRHELVVDPIQAMDGYASVPEGPGLGIELNEEIIQRYRVN